jgi:hypothetical protein
VQTFQRPEKRNIDRAKSIAYGTVVADMFAVD